MKLGDKLFTAINRRPYHGLSPCRSDRSQQSRKKTGEANKCASTSVLSRPLILLPRGTVSRIFFFPQGIVRAFTSARAQEPVNVVTLFASSKVNFLVDQPVVMIKSIAMKANLQGSF